MRILYPLLLLLLTSLAYAQPEKIDLLPPGPKKQLPPIPVKNPGHQLKCLSSALMFPPKDTTRKEVRIRCGWPKPAGSPLLVVDGTIRENAFFSTIDVDSISEVTVLNGIAGSAIFGPDGAAGAIVITTMRMNPDLIKVLDNAERSAIPGATVRFISSDKKDTLMYVADSAGQVTHKDLKKGVSYAVNVTATGYKAYAGTVAAIRNGEITLERDFILGPEVIVSSGHCCICRRHYVCQQQVSQECGVQVKMVNEQLTEKTSSLSATQILSVYPNPVLRGQSVSLKLLQGYFPSGTIRVISHDGKLLATIPVNGDRKQGLISLPTRQSWASGLYILQLVYANGRVGASVKIIIQ